MGSQLCPGEPDDCDEESRDVETEETVQQDSQHQNTFVSGGKPSPGCCSWRDLGAGGLGLDLHEMY